MSKSKNKYLSIIFSEFFTVVFLLYLTVIVIETFKQGAVNSFFNTNWLLFFLIIAFIIEISKSRKEEINKNINKNKLMLASVFISLVMSLLIYYELKNLLYLSYAISILCFLIIVIFSYLFIYENKEFNN